jgi:hypothetical protein
VSDLTRRPAPVRLPEGVMPLRPLTVGELLDAAIALLRTRPLRLVGIGAMLAVVEQAILYPLRSLADQDASLLPGTGRLSEFGWLIVAGFATEAMATGVLGAVAATGSGPALLGRFAPPQPRARPVPVALAVLVVGLVVGAAATPYVLVLEWLQAVGIVLAFMVVAVTWPLPYGLVGLAPVAAVIEQRGAGSAVVRSIRLAARDLARAAWIRLLGYASWLVLRFATILGTFGLVSLIYGNLPSSTVDRIVLAAAAAILNTIAYSVLACLDVVLLLEGRMRTEGLDIALRWALRRGVAVSLAAPVSVGAAATSAGPPVDHRPGAAR